jgi:hypothetical protein
MQVTPASAPSVETDVKTAHTFLNIGGNLSIPPDLNPRVACSKRPRVSTTQRADASEGEQGKHRKNWIGRARMHDNCLHGDRSDDTKDEDPAASAEPWWYGSPLLVPVLSHSLAPVQSQV